MRGSADTPHLVEYDAHMRRSMGVVLLVVGALLGAACGEREVPGAAAPPPAADTAAPAPEVPVETGTDIPPDPGGTAPPNSIADVDPTLVSPAGTDLEAVATTALDPSPSTTPDSGSAPLGGVTIDDPLPPQPDGTSDPEGAEVAIRYAYQHWLLVDFDQDLRGRLVENGEDGAAEMAQKLRDLRGTIDAGRIAIDSVDIADADHANVTFHITYYDRPSPIFPNQMFGNAVLQRGTWRVAANTLCLLAFGVGTGCAAMGEPNPTPPAALVLTKVPAGFTWEGDPACPSAFNANEAGSWADAAGGALTISSLTLIGVARVSGADLDALLQQQRFGGPAATTIDVGGRPGRWTSLEQMTPDGAARAGVVLVVIRADDVVLTVTAQGLTLDDAIQAAEAMQPTDAVSCSFAPEYSE